MASRGEGWRVGAKDGESGRRMETHRMSWRVGAKDGGVKSWRVGVKDGDA